MDLRMSKAVEEIILLREDDRGRSITRTVYRRRKKKKKGTGSLDKIGNMVRDAITGQRDAADLYLRKHNESNREQRDGWVRDLSYNVFRATRRGLKKVRRAVGLPAFEECD
ncbi:MAG TPA: hypothetical protein VN688_21165 [Gemmataceae bacterium]|nr:hypothetical protein [Gemmataceae bacterium]